MKRLSAIVGSLAVFLGLSGAQAQERVRVGFIPTTTVQAQIGHTLDKTDIMQRNGMLCQLVLLNSSPAVNEALVSGAIDIGFVSDFAAITVMASGAPVVALGHQSSFRGALMVASDSTAKDVADLKGKTVYGLFGVTVYQSALDMVRKAGLTPGKDVNFANMGFSELADALRARRIEAFFTWDPWIAFFEKQGLARKIEQDIAPTMVIVAREQFVREKPDVVARFLRAHAEALFYAGLNKEKTNAWFRLPEAARQIEPDVIETASNFDPNWNARSFNDIPVGFSPAQVDRLKALAQFAFSNQLTQKLAPVSERVNTAIAERVEREKASMAFDPAAVIVTYKP